MSTTFVPLRVAVVGLGPWGSRLLDALLGMPEFQVSALCDADPARLARSAGPRLRFSELGDLLAHVDVEAVVVAVAPQEQARLGVQVLQAGRHLFVEKPMALSTASARDLVDTACRAERVVCVGHVARYQPATAAALEMIRAGVVGRVERVLCERVGARPRAGVSAWWVLAPHDLSFLLAAFPDEASARAIERGESGVSHATLALGRGVRADLRILARGEPSRWTLVVGEEGALLLDEPSQSLSSFGRPPRLEPRAGAESLSAELDRLFREARSRLGGMSSEVRAFPGDALRSELRAFFEAVRWGALLPTDVHDGYRVVSMLEAAEAWESPSSRGLELKTVCREATVLERPTSN